MCTPMSCLFLCVAFDVKSLDSPVLETRLDHAFASNKVAEVDSAESIRDIAEGTSPSLTKAL